MGGQTLLIVPATVPDAKVRRVARADLDGPIVVSADPAAVPVPKAVRIVPEVLTVEHVEQLRRENRELREELARIRAH